MTRTFSWLIAGGALIALALVVSPIGATPLDDSSPVTLDAAPPPPVTPAPAPCARTEFKTRVVKEACAEGGQKRAKKVMKAFMKHVNAKRKEAGEDKLKCKSCHEKLRPDYPLTDDAVKRFEELSAKYPMP